jgi:hypothetical protein
VGAMERTTPVIIPLGEAFLMAEGTTFLPILLVWLQILLGYRVLAAAVCFVHKPFRWDALTHTIQVTLDC